MKEYNLVHQAVRSRHRTKAPCSERGQALTEFLAIALAIVPLFMLIPIIAKYQDLSHATQLASRYVSFDATVHNDGQGSWKPEQQLADEVRRRFFSTAEALIKTESLANDQATFHNPFWHDPKGNPLIDKFTNVQLSFGPARGSAHADALSAAGEGAPFSAVPLASAQILGLQARGTYTANVTVALANFPTGIRSLAPFDNINLKIDRQTSLVIDPWTSPSTVETETRFGKLVPLNKVPGESIEALLKLGIAVVDLNKVSEPQFGRLETWRDVVPQDRLSAAQ